MTARLEVDLWALRVFTEVAVSGSMTVAAERLAMTQSAVSQAVRRLEASLGVELFLRGRRPLALTGAGSLLRGRAEALVREAMQLPSVVRDAASAPTAELRIGLVDTFASTAGPYLIRTLATSATRVVVWSGLSTSLGAALLDREVDLIVTSDPLEDADGVSRTLLWREPFLLLVPKAASMRASRANLDHLAREMPLVRFSARSHIGSQIERHLRRIGTLADRRIEVDGSDALVAMVAAGVGWAIATPLCLLQGAMHASGVQALALPRPRSRRSLSLLGRRGEFPDLAARIAAIAGDALRDECLPRVRRMVPWLADEITLGQHAAHE
jgi:DNA-binding transcriptional LysR family regulator